MDMRLSRKEVAQNIIRTYDNWQQSNTSRGCIFLQKQEKAVLSLLKKANNFCYSIVKHCKIDIVFRQNLVNYIYNLRKEERRARMLIFWKKDMWIAATFKEKRNDYLQIVNDLKLQKVSRIRSGYGTVTYERKRCSVFGVYCGRHKKYFWNNFYWIMTKVEQINKAPLLNGFLKFAIDNLYFYFEYTSQEVGGNPRRRECVCK